MSGPERLSRRHPHGQPGGFRDRRLAGGIRHRPRVWHALGAESMWAEWRVIRPEHTAISLKTGLWPMHGRPEAAAVGDFGINS